MRTIIAVLTIMGLCFCTPAKAETHVRDLNPPAKITGLLGKPMGTRMVIDGVFAEHAIMLVNPLAVTRIDGQPFKAGVSIEIPGKLQIHKGVHYRLEGYEAGEFAGSPSWLAPEAQQPFQFRSCFVVSKIIEPKPAEDGALIAPQFDPIEALAKELNSNPLWPNGEAPNISLSSNAAPKEVVTRAVEMWGFDGGHIKTYQILEVRQIRLDAMPGCSAALIESDSGKKILLFRYELHDKTGLWWTRFYDAPEETEQAVQANGSQPIGFEKPVTYYLQVAQYADTFGQAPEVVFVVGEVAFRSVKDLQKAISHFPKGSTLRWSPSCRSPFGLSEEQEVELRAACESCGVGFVHVPSG